MYRQTFSPSNIEKFINMSTAKRNIVTTIWIIIRNIYICFVVFA